MEILGETLKQLDDPTLTQDCRAMLCCRVAANLTDTGQYEQARDTLGNYWQGVGVRPNVQGLSTLTTAELLLQCGVISGWLGSVRQIAGAQEMAKDLLSESFRIFEAQGQQAKAAEAQYELGRCYFRRGAYDEARMILLEAYQLIGGEDSELKARILIRRALVENWTGRHNDALRILEEARPFFDQSSDDIKSRWHGQMGLILQRLATAEMRVDYADRAIMEFTASIHYDELLGHERYCAVNLNNLAMLLFRLVRHEQAHEHLDRATKLLSRLRDDGMLAQVNETRARVLLAEHRYEEVSCVIATVVETFERGGEYALLADALIIQGVALARLGEHSRSMSILGRAINLAEDSGSLNNAGRAALALLEEHGTTRLAAGDLHSVYRRADRLLNDTQDLEDIRRLRRCAQMVMKQLSTVILTDKDFNLQKSVREFEARFIEQALEIEQGSVSRAARRLGLSPQSLAFLLKTRHRSLEGKRTSPVPRKRSIIKNK